MSVMNASASSVSAAPSPMDRSNASTKLLVKASDALEADVSPEHMTVNVTMNVRNAVRIATTNAGRRHATARQHAPRAGGAVDAAGARGHTPAGGVCLTPARGT